MKGNKTKTMKKININAYQVALVFKNGEYKKMLAEGTYWFWGNEKIIIYEKVNAFVAPIELNILLKDEVLANELQVINVQDNVIVLQFENAVLKQVLAPGRYAFWKSDINYEFIKADTSKLEISANISRAMLQHKLLVPYVRSYPVEAFQKAVLLIDGKYIGLLEPGVYYWWKNSIPIYVKEVDTRMQQVEVNGQEILTKDKAALRINAWAQYRVTDIEKAVMQNKDYEKQLYVAFQFALREYVAMLGFDELLLKKEGIADYVREAVRETVAAFGVQVNGFGIRDIILPGDMKDIMNQVLVAEKKAQANIIMRREETASTRSLLNTAKLMEENAMLWKLKEMEYVEKIAEKISNISVNSNGLLADQLKQIFVPAK